MRSSDHPDNASTLPSTFERVYAVVRRVPKGRVATYGQIAVLAEVGNPRVVGFALAAPRDDPEPEGLPWHRIINARGEISLGDANGAADEQRTCLEAEGVAFDARGRIDLATCRWSEGIPTWPRP